MERRTLLGAGGVIAATGVIAACGGSNGQDTAATSGAESPPSQDGGATAAGGANSVPASQVPVGGGVILDEAAVVVVQPQDGTFLAFTAVCPHQGCLVSEVVDNSIVCACHDSVFSATDGSVIQGPALQGLAQATISVDGDTITVA